MGCTRMVLSMMVDPIHRNVLKEVLLVGCALLKDGNKVCKMTSKKGNK